MCEVVRKMCVRNDDMTFVGETYKMYQIVKGQSCYFGKKVWK